MSIYVYTLVHDTGFAPNPFHGFCTLACCKPKIRAGASVGDWVVGITPKAYGHRLAYYMRVDETLTFGQYFRDPRFAAKKPHDVSGLSPPGSWGPSITEITGDPGTVRWC